MTLHDYVPLHMKQHWYVTPNFCLPRGFPNKFLIVLIFFTSQLTAYVGLEVML
jgi:hypothetical protein